MSDREQRLKSLTDYCLAHRCESCPMNTPELGILDVLDNCIVDMAISRLDGTPAGIDPTYEAARADQ
jgi:hypothetical protein